MSNQDDSRGGIWKLTVISTNGPLVVLGEYDMLYSALLQWRAYMKKPEYEDSPPMSYLEVHGQCDTFDRGDRIIAVDLDYVIGMDLVEYYVQRSVQGAKD